MVTLMLYRMEKALCFAKKNRAKDQANRLIIRTRLGLSKVLQLQNFCILSLSGLSTQLPFYNSALMVTEQLRSVSFTSNAQT